MIAIPHGILDNRSMISIPTATKISANPITRFKIHHTPPALLLQIYDRYFKIIL